MDISPERLKMYKAIVDTYRDILIPRFEKLYTPKDDSEKIRVYTDTSTNVHDGVVTRIDYGTYASICYIRVTDLKINLTYNKKIANKFADVVAQFAKEYKFNTNIVVQNYLPQYYKKTSEAIEELLRDNPEDMVSSLL